MITKSHFPARSTGPVFLAASLALLLLCATCPRARAGSATWKSNPRSGDWDTASNWTPATVPNGVNDVATFGQSQITDVSISIGQFNDIDLDSLVFASNASAFTINTNESFAVSFYGAGIVNNSGITQQIVVPTGDVFFENQASAGSGILFTINGGSGGAAAVGFVGQSRAGTCSYVAMGAAAGQQQGGIVSFLGGSADHGTFIMQGGTIAAGGGFTDMQSGDGGHGTFEMGGGHVDGAGGGAILVRNSASAGDATLICRGGLVKGAGGGEIVFQDTAHGARARVELFGNSLLDISDHDAPGLAVGSVEGKGGMINLGDNVLGIGTNGRSTKFAGIIQDGPGFSGGQLTKTGKGTLTLLGASTYTGVTTIEQGTLAADNTTGSATGTGAVQVAGGMLSGSGIIAGPVTVASSAGAVLAPGAGIATNRLTLQSSLTFGGFATFQVDLNSTAQTADQVVANGITINSGAQVTLQDLAGAVLSHGTVFTLLNNTSSGPIIGNFRNLTDGAQVTVGANTYRVSYQGGDGNDLTLTLLP